MRKLIIFVAFAALAVSGPRLVAQQATKADLVVASTTWTAAFVRAAGFTGTVHVLAPAELQHPPEYELKPSDIAAAAKADFIVFAGYERMAEKLKEAAGGSGGNGVVLVQIGTDYSLKTLEQSIRKLGAAFGTEDAAERNLKTMNEFYTRLKSDIAAKGAAGRDVICHAMQVPFLKELGFAVKGVYGPAPLEPSQLKSLAGIAPLFIVDNWHNRVSKPLTDLYPKVPIAVFINFPGHGGTVTLSDVLEYNGNELMKTLVK